MAEQNISPRDFFATESAIADLGLIACPGAEELCKLVDGHLVRWAREVGMDVDTFIIPSDCPRFQSGDAKGPGQGFYPWRRPVYLRRSGQLQRYLPAVRL